MSNTKMPTSLQKESHEQVSKRIANAVDEIKRGEAQLISFTANEFEKFSESLVK